MLRLRTRWAGVLRHGNGFLGTESASARNMSRLSVQIAREKMKRKRGVKLKEPEETTATDIGSLAASGGGLSVAEVLGERNSRAEALRTVPEEIEEEFVMVENERVRKEELTQYVEDQRAKMLRRGLDFIPSVEDYLPADDAWHNRPLQIFRFAFIRSLRIIDEKETNDFAQREILIKDIDFRAKWNNASIVLAAYDILREIYGDERAMKLVSRVLHSQRMGKLSAAIMKMVHWMSKIIQGNEVKRQMGVYEAVAKDFGESFRPELYDRDNKLTLKVNRCMYNEMFHYEEVPELTQLFCAMDLATFQAFSGESSTVLTECIRTEAPACQFTFHKKSVVEDRLSTDDKFGDTTPVEVDKNHLLESKYGTSVRFVPATRRTERQKAADRQSSEAMVPRQATDGRDQKEVVG